MHQKKAVVVLCCVFFCVYIWLCAQVRGFVKRGSDCHVCPALLTSVIEEEAANSLVAQFVFNEEGAGVPGQP